MCHKFIIPLENFEILQIEGNRSHRKRLEELLMLKENKKVNISNLMNIKMEFKNEHVFCKISNKFCLIVRSLDIHTKVTSLTYLIQ